MSDRLAFNSLLCFVSPQGVLCVCLSIRTSQVGLRAIKHLKAPYTVPGTQEMLNERQFPFCFTEASLACSFSKLVPYLGNI